MQQHLDNIHDRVKGIDVQTYMYMLCVCNCYHFTHCNLLAWMIKTSFKCSVGLWKTLVSYPSRLRYPTSIIHATINWHYACMRIPHACAFLSPLFLWCVFSDKCPNMTIRVLSLRLLVLALLPVALLAAENGEVVSSGEAEGSGETSCPGYQSGNPGQRNMSGCETGSSLGVVDHIKAFGFNRTPNPDWNSCDLPELPEAKLVYFFLTSLSWLRTRDCCLCTLAVLGRCLLLLFYIFGIWL